MPPPLPGPVERTRSIVVASLLRSREWIHRRTETVSVLDESSIHKRVTFDLTVPRVVRGRVQVDRGILPFVPLTLLPKLKLRNFDMTDAAGRRLPILTTAENGRVAAQTLRIYAESVLGRPPGVPVATDLALIATSTGDQLRGAMNRMLEPQGSADEADRRALIEAEEFLSLLVDLGANFLLAVVADPRPGERQLLKFSYDAEGRRGNLPARSWFATRMGWMPADFSITTEGAVDASSYHVEIVAPADVEIVAAELHANGQTLDFEGGGVARAHLHTDMPVQAYPTPYARARFRVVRTGFLYGALFTAALTTALLWLGRVRLDQLTTSIEASSALLLILPGLLAAYLARPGEHALATSVLVGVRWMLVISALCALVGAAVLAAHLPPRSLRFVWDFVGTLSVLSLVGLGSAVVLPMRGARPGGST